WFDERVRELAPVLRAVALRQCRNQADAEDLLQTTFECALRDLARFDRSTNFRAWVTGILTHRILQLARQRRRPVELVSDCEPLGGAAPDPSDAAESWRQVSVEDLLRVLPSVKAPFREVFHLHAMERKSYKEIAARLGIPMGTVTSRLKRARDQLRELLLPMVQEVTP
ncbi:MAG TPA: RNA polymerase sigma factor, partial [Myxococcales bacterium]|nr:RNA polymerase sigma factor [Myxococcales bacterium]